MLALRAGLLTLTSASVCFLKLGLTLPSSSSVRVHPSRLVLSMPLYELNCVLARMQVGRCSGGPLSFLAVQIWRHLLQLHNGSSA